MERETSFLRCSKLSSYVEFNRMVQALSAHRNHRKGESGTTIHTPSRGTCAEYNFYQTLAIMLNQVLHNPHQEIQKQELLTIYQWFSLNKPLATPSIKRKDTPKPQIFLNKSKAHQSLDIRPQTAPAVIGYSRASTPHCPPSTPAPPVLSFTSSFVTRSLSANDRPISVPLPSKERHWGGGEHKKIDAVTGSKIRNNSGLASPSFGISGASLHLSPSDQTSRPITPAIVVSSVTGVAAEMTLERLAASWQHSQIRRVTKRAATVGAPTACSRQLRLSIEPNNEEKEEEREKDLPKSLSEGALETIAEEREEEEGEKLNKSRAIKGDNISSKEIQGNDKEKNSEEDEQMDSHVLANGDSRGGGHVTSVRISRGVKKGSPPKSSCFLSTNTRQGHKIGVVTLELDSSRCPGQLQDNKRLCSPKPLATIVAGFNKHKYKSRKTHNVQ
ncbi:PREDICTED: uncharacterized protein LOC109591767 isoform X2 [Amphimedon queenslandica]|uniref:Uncharacterized protein n=1 Tax=Amphimedon queenslandica TaxID=400682 RepID=A0A1X7VMC8_AMPQE|nr:PREDICTED: uncharacterized protein LOC109591767 isoform X2 [Amphimedon queenslandica]|eukprot:XP_019862982.1 PREDICTED: uncharacterized protein LOC109591767 isoform X2 [Amphimedon queenslandica]